MDRGFVNFVQFRTVCSALEDRGRARFTFTLGLQGSRGRQVDPAIDRKQHQNVGTLPLPTVNYLLCTYTVVVYVPKCHLRSPFFSGRRLLGPQ